MQATTCRKVCTDRERLSEKFAIAAREFSEAVVKLAQDHSRSSEARYVQLRTNAREARRQSEMSESNLERHIEEHGC